LIIHRRTTIDSTISNYSSLFRRFEPAIREQEFNAPTDANNRLLMDRDGDFSIYYAPLDHVNERARLVIVGITPGATQMLRALHHVRSALKEGADSATALRRAKTDAAFSGSQMRPNLLRQLTDWGVPEWLGIADAESLFGKRADLLHTTSLLKYPVFYRGKNYEGNPPILHQRLLRQHLVQHFAGEARLLRSAIFVGLGPKVWQVLEWLVGQGIVRREQVCNGMMHPSGNNTYRLNWILSDRSAPAPSKTSPTAYDAGRLNFRRQVGLG
jgi:hypothetical protein